MSTNLKSIMFGVMIGCGLLAQAHGAGRPAHATMAAANSNVTRATLDNGLRVVIVRNRLAPMVTTQITYLAGGYQTPVGQPGIAHAVEHMLFRDSKGMSGTQLNEMTGKMGGNSNAFTTSDATQYYFVAPAQYLGILLRIESIRMRGAMMTAKDWAVEKGAIEQEVARDISGPSYHVAVDADRALFAGTGYAEDPLGTRPSFDKTTAQDLHAFYDTWYQPNNAILVIVGDVDPQATLGQVKQLFGAIPSHPLPQRANVALRPFAAKTLQGMAPNQDSSSVLFLYRLPGQRSKDYAAAQLLMDALANTRSGLSGIASMGKVLRVNAGIQSFGDVGVGYFEVAFHDYGDDRTLHAAMDGEVDAILKHGVPADLIESARRSELARFEFNKNSAVTQASAWSQALAWQGLDSPGRAEQQIRGVSADDVNRIAREWLRPGQRLTMVLTPDLSGSKRPPDSAGFGGAESFGRDDKLDKPLPDWAATAFGKLEMPHWTLAPQRMQLANGITLIVQPETISRTVTLMGHIDHNPGMQEPVGKEGVGRLLDTLFDYGTTSLDRSAFHKALDDVAATESGGSDFRLAVPSDRFERGVQLLADNELRPALLQDAFADQQEKLQRTIVGEWWSSSDMANRAYWKGLLPTGDPQLRKATPDSVALLKLQDVKHFLARVFRPDMTTIVVVGNVTPNHARAVIGKYFGAWKAIGPRPAVIASRVPLNPASCIVIPDAYASQE